MWQKYGIKAPISYVELVGGKVDSDCYELGIVDGNDGVFEGSHVNEILGGIFSLALPQYDSTEHGYIQSYHNRLPHVVLDHTSRRRFGIFIL